MKSIITRVQFFLIGICGVMFSDSVQANTPPIDLINVVWGREYTNLFLDWALPLQLCPRNLGCLSACSIRYRIFTTKGDWEYMQAHPSMIKLHETAKVDFVEISYPNPGVHRHHKMKQCHDQAIADAGQIGAALIFLAPDLLLSNQCFETILKKVELGYRTILFNTLDLRENALDSMGKILRDETIQKNGISPRDLIGLGMQYCHPSHLEIFVNGQTNCFPCGLFWKLDDLNNMIIHVWGAHPIYIWPENYSPYGGQVDHSLVMHACPNQDTWVMIQDSDEMAGWNLASVKGPEYRYTRSAPFNPASIATWAKQNVIDAQDLYIFARPLYLHSTGHKEEWEKIEKEESEFILKVLDLYRH